MHGQEELEPSQEELEPHVLSQNWGGFGLTEMWWDSLLTWGGGIQALLERVVGNLRRGDVPRMKAQLRFIQALHMTGSRSG